MESEIGIFRFKSSNENYVKKNFGCSMLCEIRRGQMSKIYTTIHRLEGYQVTKDFHGMKQEIKNMNTQNSRRDDKNG